MINVGAGYHLVFTVPQPLHPDAEMAISEHFGGEVTIVTGVTSVALVPVARWGWWIPWRDRPAGGGWLTTDAGALVVADTIAELRDTVETLGVEALTSGRPLQVPPPMQARDWASAPAGRECVR